MVIFYMMDINIVNSFNVAQQFHLKSFKEKRRQFIIYLGKELPRFNAK